MMRSFKIYANEQSKIENIIKKINSKINNSDGKNYLFISKDELAIHILLDKRDSLKLSYDCDSSDITHIDFELENNMVSSISLNDLKYVYVEAEDENILTSATFFLKDNSSFEIFTI